jgi:hypothetical protein
MLAMWFQAMKIAPLSGRVSSMSAGAVFYLPPKAQGIHAPLSRAALWPKTVPWAVAF